MNLPPADIAPAPESPVSPPMGLLRTTTGHRLFALIGIAFFIFEMIFLTFFGSDFWFESHVTWWGLGFVLVALGTAHCLLSWMETPSGCYFFAPIWKGRPPIVYKRWIALDESGITFGTRHVLWEAVDSAALTIWGNVVIRSRAVCGPAAREADIVLKFPLSPAPAESQTALIETLKARLPTATFNNRLIKRRPGATVKGTALVQSLGGAFMLIVLLDVGHSSFSFLEMMKEYYLAQTSARDGQMDEAKQHFETAEAMFKHPLPISWATKLLTQKAAGATVEEARAEALWRMGKRDEAIEAARKSVELAPDHLSLSLRLARMLAETGKLKEARQEIRTAIDDHEESLLPRLYLIALLKDSGSPALALKMYDLHIQRLVDVVFGEEPLWPPGGNRFLHEIIRQDDAIFVFDRLIGKRPSNQK